MVWIQTDSRAALAKWGNHHKYKLTPDRAATRLKLLSESDEGFKLYKTLEPTADDLYVRKIKFSAMVGDSSNLDRVLRDDGLRNRMSEAAREHAARFTWEATARGTLEVLAAAAIARRQRGAR